MASTYTSFLQSPSATHLASDASLNYITTTTSINESAAILKHLQAQLKQVAKKEERVLNTIEGSNSLVLEVETTLQFNNGGGAYLPSMDENVLDEKLVTFPVVHVVTFDGDQRIKQIRLYWDQGTLLKQVEAIGRTGRNWPIRDGKAQIESVTASVKSGPVESTSKTPLGSRDPNEVAISPHKRGESVAHRRDPQELFNPRDVNAEAYDGPKTAPRASAKPAPREYGELFAGGDSPKAASKVRSPSPSKADGVIFKSGAGKHHVGNRLFDENEQSAALRSPERKKTYDQKYQHFTFGDGEDVPQGKRPESGRGSKGQATFSFEDFATPPKYQSKVRRDDELHWGADDPPSPPKRPVVHAARKDADSHWQLTDTSSPAIEKPHSAPTAKGNLNLYHDPVSENFEDEPVKKPSDTTTSVDNARRGNDFGPHYTMSDNPSQPQTARPTSRGQRSDMDQHWSHDTPKIYKTAGDGMGSRKGADAGVQQTKSYKTAGDGMGGRRKNGEKSWWEYGDEMDEPLPSVRGRRAQTAAGAQS